MGAIVSDLGDLLFSVTGFPVSEVAIIHRKCTGIEHLPKEQVSRGLERVVVRSR